jgi:hypothetical protein
VGGLDAGHDILGEVPMNFIGLAGSVMSGAK